jgi:hypothetical protein
VAARSPPEAILATPAAREAPVAERRLVTVLFADAASRGILLGEALAGGRRPARPRHARFAEYDALVELETAQRMFRELGMPYFVAATEADRASHVAAAGSAVDAQQLLAEARETLERLGAKPFLAALGRERAVA